jgi:hypothetical protein
MNKLKARKSLETKFAQFMHLCGKLWKFVKICENVGVNTAVALPFTISHIIQYTQSLPSTTTLNHNPQPSSPTITCLVSELSEKDISNVVVLAENSAHETQSLNIFYRTVYK